MFGIGTWLKAGALGLAVGCAVGWTVKGWQVDAGQVDSLTEAYSDFANRQAERARLAELNNRELAAAKASLETEVADLQEKNRAPLPLTFRPAIDIAGVASCPDPRGPEWLRRYNEAAAARSAVTDASRVRE